MKVIEVDWDDPKNLKKTISLLQQRRKKVLKSLGYEHIKFNGNSSNAKNLLPIFNSFVDRLSKNSGEYYVYAHCNPLQPLNVQHNIKDLWLASKFSVIRNKPFYIGKGIGTRKDDLNRNDSHRKIRTNIERFGKEIEVVTLYEGINEESSLLIEGALIEVLGLMSLSKEGFLVNLDEGKDRNNIRETYPANMIKILKANNFYLTENMKSIITSEKKWVRRQKDIL